MAHKDMHDSNTAPVALDVTANGGSVAPSVNAANTSRISAQEGVPMAYSIY